VKEGEASSGEPGITEEYGVKIGHRVCMADWVAFFSSELGGPFEDDTGLKGLYDFKLEWSPAATPRGGRDPRDSDDGISLFAALQQQLGLKLERKKIPVEVFIVEHVSKIPTEN
jgi:bla regulator protein blaR1